MPITTDSQPIAGREATKQVWRATATWHPDERAPSHTGVPRARQSRSPCQAAGTPSATEKTRSRTPTVPSHAKDLRITNSRGPPKRFVPVPLQRIRTLVVATTRTAQPEQSHRRQRDRARSDAECAKAIVRTASVAWVRSPRAANRHVRRMVRLCCCGAPAADQRGGLNSASDVEHDADAVGYGLAGRVSRA
jgi:hypothetical protein